MLFYEYYSLSLQTMMKTVYFLLLSLAMAGCHQRSMTERMSVIDSLVVQEMYDSAYASVLRINRSELTEREDSAHYYLLLVQTSLLTQHSATLTILDSLVIPYYNNMENHEKLAEAYYYKAYDMVRQRDIAKAIQLYKKAEEQAYITSKLRLQYKISENLSYYNGITGNHTLQLDYAQKSLDIAKSAKKNEWIAYALCRMSFAYKQPFCAERFR